MVRDALAFSVERSPAETIAAWHRRPSIESAGSPINALTIDVEDYFQVEAFTDVIDRGRWNSYSCRVERNVDKILELLEQTGSRATFFTLAWIAARFPNVVRSIVSRGHELASHGSEHRRADAQTPSQFLDDVTEAKSRLEDISGAAVAGFRAPCFSISRTNLWAIDTLAEAGYRYSSSTYPITHDRYGIPEAPRFAFYPLSDRPFLEIPVTSYRWLGRNWPCGGGGYFRLLPYGVTKFALDRVRRVEGRSIVFYFHPWEIDPDQPRIPGAPLGASFRHYLNLSRTEARVSRLLSAFRWGRVDEIFLPSNDVRR